MKKVILALLLLPCLIGAAQLYKVELIVFSHVTEAGLNSETWPLVVSMPNMDSVQNLLPLDLPSAQTSSTELGQPIYKMLPSTDFGLNADELALTHAKNYSVLVHMAWLQPGEATRLSPRIRIMGGQGYDANGQTVINGQPAQFSTIDGFVRVSRPYTFQVDADLVLTLPENAVQSLTSKLTEDVPLYHFTLLQSEHPKLNDVYYFDHPLFGMLLQITPVKNV